MTIPIVANVIVPKNISVADTIEVESSPNDLITLQDVNQVSLIQFQIAPRNGAKFAQAILKAIEEQGNP